LDRLNTNLDIASGDRPADASEVPGVQNHKWAPGPAVSMIQVSFGI
jgi:hypothetical protein